MASLFISSFVLCMILYDAISQFVKTTSPLPIGALSVIACLPIYCFYKHRLIILKRLTGIL